MEYVIDDARVRPPMHLSPSAAERWIYCPGSVELADGMQAAPSAAAFQGTVAHEVARRCLVEGVEPWEYAGATFRSATYPDMSVVVDDEMVDGVAAYVSYVAADGIQVIRDHAVGDGVRLVEVRVELPHVSPLLFGQLDTGILGARHIEVVDFKFGAGVAVYPERNPQLMIYAIGALREAVLRRPGIVYPDDTAVVLTIVQPRCERAEGGPIRSWSTTVGELLRWEREVLIPAARAATIGSRHRVPSPDRCRFCPARFMCPDLHEKVAKVAPFAGMKGGIPQAPLDDAALGRALAMAQIAEVAIKALKEEAYTRLMRGAEVEGYKLVPAKSNRTWKDGAEAALVESYGDAAYSKALVSPAQADKLSGGKKFTTKWAYKPDAGLTLASEDDRREGVSRNPADVFKGV